MRDKETLLSFDDIAVFYQYLYLDENNRITFNNGVTNLTLRMTDHLGITCKNESFPDLPETDYTDSLNPSQILAIIDILKQQPSTEYTNNFTNKWDEIKTLTKIQLGLNKIKE